MSLFRTVRFVNAKSQRFALTVADKRQRRARRFSVRLRLEYRDFAARSTPQGVTLTFVR